VESDLGKAMVEFTSADKALQESVERVLNAINAPDEESVIAEVASLATRLSHALDELAITVEQHIYDE
jgi:hypothetical protein